MLIGGGEKGLARLDYLGKSQYLITKTVHSSGKPKLLQEKKEEVFLAATELILIKIKQSTGATAKIYVCKKIIAKQAKIAEAEAAKAAAIKAEQEAAEKLAASRPKVNTGKIFNKNIEEFKCVEETRADGSIIRRYFDPYASNGKSNPMITTIDRGNYHEEIIYDPRKGIKLTYKQLGTGEPEIEMTKGLQYRYTSKYNKRTYYRENTQQYNHGQNFVESHGRDNYTPKQLVTKNPHSTELQAQRGEPEYIKRVLNNTYEQNKALAKRFDEIKQDMAHNEVDLIDLFRPYKP